MGEKGMPELPEVEAVRMTLANLITGKEMIRVWANYPDIVKEPIEFQQFAKRLEGERFESVLRKGKFLILETSQYAMISHLRMEGKYVLADAQDPYHKHTHLFFTFSDGTELRYEDVRKFGTIHLVKRGRHMQTPMLQRLGPDAIEVDFHKAYLKEKVRNRTRSIKSLLLDQEIVAGLGNIYVDEVLFHANVHPLQTGAHLSDQDLQRIVQGAKEILQKSIALGGSTVRSYLNAQGKMGTFQNELKIYGKNDLPCIVCGQRIEKIKVAGRGTHYCPQCQKKSV